MSHHSTGVGQLLTLLPRHEVDAEARDHQRGQHLRVMSRWAQVVALGLGQLASRQSLRDIVRNLRAQQHHLGRQDDRRPVQVPVADRAVLQVDQTASEGETFRGPVEERATQLWVATSMYLLLAYLKFVLRLCWSLNQILQVLQHNVFERRPLEDLFKTKSPPDRARPQLALAWA